MTVADAVHEMVAELTEPVIVLLAVVVVVPVFVAVRERDSVTGAVDVGVALIVDVTVALDVSLALLLVDAEAVGCRDELVDGDTVGVVLDDRVIDTVRELEALVIATRYCWRRQCTCWFEIHLVCPMLPHSTWPRCDGVRRSIRECCCARHAACYSGALRLIESVDEAVRVGDALRVVVDDPLRVML